MAKKKTNEEAFTKAMAFFEEANKHHSEFVQQAERRYRSYRGVIEAKEQAKEDKSKDWRANYRPRHVMHIIETALASLVDPDFQFRCKPVSSFESLLDPSHAERAVEGARLHQLLANYQATCSEPPIGDTQRDFVLQNLITGLTVAKTYWQTISETRRRMVPSPEPLQGGDGVGLLGPDGSSQMTMTMKEETGVVTVYDGPVTEVRDVRDFFWHESAVSLERSRYVIDRVRMTIEEIMDHVSQEDGMFGPNKGGWTEKQIKDALADGKGFQDETSYREKELFSQDRTKDLVEVLEVWDLIEKKVTTIANRRALLSYKDFPFHHNGVPFVICSTQPDSFRIPGISMVERIEDLQKMLWSLGGQRLDNLRLINNAIFLFSPDVDDEDAYYFEPGARWIMEDPTQVQMWTPSVIPAEVSLGSEALLNSQMQDISGGFPFASGADAQALNQRTATGAGMISQIAQRGVALSKQEVYKAWTKVGKQRGCLNQQFLREPTVAPVAGPDKKEMIQIILPELLGGDYSWSLEPSTDSINKQEDQAAAQALMQLAVEIFPLMAPLAAQGGKIPNLEAFAENMLRAFGKDDIQHYFSQMTPPPAPATGGQPSGGPSSSEGQGAAPLGITGPGSIDTAVSPSAMISSSPTTMLQRALALSRGGAVNGPS